MNKNYFKNKNILVTGATGFIGTNLIKELVKLEANITGVIHKKKPKIKFPDIKYISADLLNSEECNIACKDIDIIFMCAANSSGASVIETTPLAHLTPNIVMNSLMLEAAYKNNVKKFVFISSNTVYPVTDYPVSEDDVNYEFFHKYHIVGWMKLFSEQMCKMYSSHIKNPMNTLIVRPGNIYGPYDKYSKKDSKVIAALIRRFAEQESPLNVWGDGQDIKDFIYIDDFIDGLIMVASENNFTGPINISSGKSVTIKKVIDTLCEITKQTNLEIFYDSTKPTMIPVRLISNKLAQSLFKIKINHSLFEGLKKTYDWYKIFYSNKKPEDLE